MGADGKIASGLAVGGPTVISLLRNEAPNLLDPTQAGAEEPQPAAPRGVAVGGKAPNTQLQDLDGQQVNLDDIRNGRTALLFWNPGCGFCQRLLPDLKTWEADKPTGAPKLVLISTGTADRTASMVSTRRSSSTRASAPERLLGRRERHPPS